MDGKVEYSTTPSPKPDLMIPTVVVFVFVGIGIIVIVIAVYCKRKYNKRQREKRYRRHVAFATIEPIYEEIAEVDEPNIAVDINAVDGSHINIPVHRNRARAKTRIPDTISMQTGNRDIVEKRIRRNGFSANHQNSHTKAEITETQSADRQQLLGDRNYLTVTSPYDTYPRIIEHQGDIVDVSDSGDSYIPVLPSYDIVSFDKGSYENMYAVPFPGRELERVL